MLALAALALLDRREVHAPALAPVRLLGEEAGEELGEVAVAGGGQHAEAAEQLELQPVAGDAGRRVVHCGPGLGLRSPKPSGRSIASGSRGPRRIGEQLAQQLEAVALADVDTR